MANVPIQGSRRKRRILFYKRFKGFIQALILSLYRGSGQRSRLIRASIRTGSFYVNNLGLDRIKRLEWLLYLIKRSMISVL